MYAYIFILIVRIRAWNLFHYRSLFVECSLIEPLVFENLYLVRCSSVNQNMKKVHYCVSFIFFIMIYCSSEFFRVLA